MPPYIGLLRAAVISDIYAREEKESEGMDEFDRPGSRDRSPSSLALPRRGGKLSEHDVTLSGRVALRCSAYDERERERERARPAPGARSAFCAVRPATMAASYTGPGHRILLITVLISPAVSNLLYMG